MTASRAWIDKALCRDADPDLFFPSWGDSLDEAMSVCLQCPVRAECLEYALGFRYTDGIWAGTSGSQRRKILEQRDGVEP